MVGCDLARMALVAGMAVPAGPFWAPCTLLAAAELLSAPFGAARAALLPEVRPDDRYVVASAVSNVAIQGGQLSASPPAAGWRPCSAPRPPWPSTR